MTQPAAALVGLGALFLVMKQRQGTVASGTDQPKAPHDPCLHKDKDACATMSYSEIVDEWVSEPGIPEIGKLYQVVPGDTNLIVARKALFGSAEPRTKAVDREAIRQLSIRMDCGPWNQTVAGRDKSMLAPGHYAVEEGYTNKGIYYMPVFPDNLARLRQGQSPVVGPGRSFPLIWIPQIDLDKFMTTGEITTFGQDWADDGNGAYNMIDPPPWVIDLQFEGELEPGVAGCNLPEGDFRKTITLEAEGA
jgi:hypothetical protein